jgi:hypothetical protein
MKTKSIGWCIMSACVLAVLLGSGVSAAINPIPEESGFSGFLNVGASYIDLASNMVKGTEIGSFSSRTIDSIFDGPDSESDFSPIVNGELAYTFADRRTQVYFGNQLEDFLRFDFSTLAGVRQEFSDKSVGGISYVFSGIATEVWKDPYVAGTPRDDTERNSKGLRLDWDRLAGTMFGLQYQWRTIDVDDELSGTLGGLGLTPGEVDQLDREGDHHRGEVHYTWALGGGHAIIPAFRYARHDLDGDAMAFDRYRFLISYAYRAQKYSLVANASIGLNDHDERNPIYGKTREDDTYGVGLTAFWHQPFGLPQGFSLVGTAGYYEADSNIDFYDSDALIVGTSVFYKF